METTIKMPVEKTVLVYFGTAQNIADHLNVICNMAGKTTTIKNYINHTFSQRKVRRHK